MKPVGAGTRHCAWIGLMVCGSAAAFEIDTGTSNLAMRWDNTFRYNYIARVGRQDPALLANFSIDDGDRNFDRGTVSNRLDLLSEFDAIWADRVGLRVSGAAWYDDAYRGTLDNRSPATSNHLDRNGEPAIGLSREADRYFRGPSGELLDAFALTKFDLAGAPVAVKAGRHTQFWGESLLLGGAIHGVSYGQMPIDAAKGFAVPGAEIKELFRPLNSVSLQTQATDTIALAGQYFLEWQPFRVPESGTFLGFNDALLEGGESVILRDGVRVVREADLEPAQRGHWGAMARWSPDFLDGSLSFYYRRFADMLPQVFVVADAQQIADNGCGTPPASAACAVVGTYQFAYPDDVTLYGLSLSQQIAGLSVGVEVNYREGMPLASEPAVIVEGALPAALQGPVADLLQTLRQPTGVPGAPAVPAVQVSALPQAGEAAGARGDTLHALVSAVGVLPTVELFGLTLLESGIYMTEFTWSHWTAVTEHEALFKGRDDYRALDRVSRDNYAIAATVSPVWYQVLPGIDLAMPMAYSLGIKGNSAIQFGGSEAGGAYSFGLSADVRSRYRVELKYGGFFGDYSTDANGVATVLNGATAALSDRDFLSLTLKTTF